MPNQNGQSPDQFTDLAPHYDELMDIVPYDAWADYVFLLFQVAQHDPQKLLDCACGTGNVSFELAKSGVEITGVDIAPAMIEVARAKNLKLNGNLRFLEADLTDFDLGEKFDSATCLYDSLNYITDPQKLQNAFICIAKHLENGGIFVFDMNSDWALKTDLFTQFNRDPRKSLHYDWHAHFDAATRITTVEMRFSQTQSDGTTRQFVETHRERAYELSEIELMLESAGFDLLKTYDAYTINPPHDQSERWFFVAVRV